MDDDQCDLDPIKLREYERSRMRYYYAVIECDSKTTAEKIYDACDGMEFEMSGIPIDLRFVPENQKFPHSPKEVCDEVPADSQVKNIYNRSIGHTNTKLTWDQPQDRFKFMDGKTTEKDYEKVDWSKYIAPSEDVHDSEDELQEESDVEIEDENLGSDEELEKLEQQALRQQQEIDNLNWKKSFDKKNKKKKEGEIVIKFNAGFNDLGNKILEKQKSKNETIFETKDRQRKEKKEFRKQMIKDKKNGKKRSFAEVEDTEESRKERQNLELLVDKEESSKDIKVALNDPRFEAIYKTSDYAIDPTSKFYNKDTSARTLQEQINRRKQRKLNEQ